MTTPENARTFADYFSDPYDVTRSFQLSERLRKNDTFSSIERIKDGEAAWHARQYRRFMRTVAPVLSPFTASQRREIVNRVVYNDLFLCGFEPRRFQMPLRAAEGRFAVGSQASHHRELDFGFETVRKTYARE